MRYKVSIAQPCNQDWIKMSPNGNGRYCDECKLTVVDFTNMTDEEIQSYLTDKSYVCGRFRCNQVNTRTAGRLDFVKEKIGKIPFTLLKYVLMFLVALPLLISSCVYRAVKKLNDNNLDDKKNRLMGYVVSPKYQKKSGIEL